MSIYHGVQRLKCKTGWIIKATSGLIDGIRWKVILHTYTHLMCVSVRVGAGWTMLGLGLVLVVSDDVCKQNDIVDEIKSNS